ncbi:MAG: hypothetical protein ISP69_05260 [Crocinitomicaceae bacterium]|nr:hypothetical protein [Crocinitomicaceae bacterium]|tara:strand:- start:1689 stop:2129 length:441 start_codon:yes stop_codon:yes gene_type:complete
MKYKLLLLSFLFVGLGFAQKHVAPYKGSYHLDFDGTNQIMIEKGLASADQEIPEEVKKQMEAITLKIQKGKITMNIMGKKREMKFSDRPSSLEDAACDLVLILDKAQAIEGAKENFLTLMSLGEGKIQLISEQSNDTNNFVWKRVE